MSYKLSNWYGALHCTVIPIPYGALLVQVMPVYKLQCKCHTNMLTLSYKLPIGAVHFSGAPFYQLDCECVSMLSQ